MVLKIMVTDSSGREVSADLGKGASFELEMEQPLLATDRVPVPFSTSIAFPATDTNKRLFGFIPAMMMEPSQKKLAARIMVDGVEIAAGVLTYNGLQDGQLQYSFGGKDLEDVWQRKIWNITEDLDESVDEETRGLGIAGYSFTRWMGFPVLISSAATTEIYAGTTAGTIQDAGIKYRNYRGPGDVCTRTTPAVFIGVILGQAAGNVSMNEGLAEILENLAILGIYKNTETWGGHDDQAGTYLNAGGWFKMLPDVTIADLARETMKLCASAMFKDGAGYKVVSFGDIASETEVLDWTEKVSSIYDSEYAAAQLYRFRFANNSLAEVPLAGNKSFTQIIDAFLNHTPPAVDPDNGYSWQNHKDTGDRYAGKKYSGMAGMIECDITSHYLGPTGEDDDAEGREVFDQSPGFEVVKCIPETLYRYADGTGITNIVAPVLDFVQPSADRGSSMIIGLIANRQMCDKGITIKDSEDDESLNTSLSAGYLLDKYHTEFAAWTEKDRQEVSADLNLSVAELSNFRLWQKVRFAHREWLVKKLAIDFEVSGRMVVRGDFISL